jgi:hypothetical protein
MRGWRTMRSPTGVSNAGKSTQVVFLDLGVQVCNTGSAARALQFAVNVQGNAAGIVTAVFQPFQAFYQNGSDVSLRNCADNAAHINLLR